MAHKNPVDAVFEAVADEQRRQILADLFDADSRGYDPDTPAPPIDVSSYDNQAVLHHNHLPRLDAQGFIEWSPETSLIRRGERFDDLAAVLAMIDEERPVATV